VTIQSILTTSNQILVTSAVATTYAGLEFKLTDFAEYQDYVGLFDQYRFDQLEVWIEPIHSNASAQYGLLATAIDLDDAITPASMNSIEAHQQSLVGSGAAGQYHRWVPHIALAANGGGVFTSYANAASTWIDAGSPGVSHYGFKVGALLTPSPIAYQLTTRAKVSFRSPGF